MFILRKLESRLIDWFLRLEDGAARRKVEKAKKGMKHCGERVAIRRDCMFIRPELISIGDNTGIGERCYFRGGGKIHIGRWCQIANNVIVVTTNHKIEKGRRYAGNTETFDVTIGDNVWIGSGAIVLPNVRIGDNSVISAGAVVTKDVPADVIAAGVPARIIRAIE